MAKFFDGIMYHRRAARHSKNHLKVHAKPNALERAYARASLLLVAFTASQDAQMAVAA